ncbi:hypothetical protein OEZ71_04410 [Defluviimonas sp. WL0050]|uniref:Uncharacterized protein n=1 Tax=Albidovulum litorale TaxID=2984134 RepID=A0ABT2ZK76_9RHOB|nr:hypothetical protein [Defluviimonas sp. WL0050]MCV2871532.1 hypothetical protein [Defluviimonas sp. WL0050]
MPRYNEMFELSVSDIDLIETALSQTRDTLSRDIAGQSGNSEKAVRLKQVQELLGRLHNQKIFYRPKDGVYIGG